MLLEDMNISKLMNYTQQVEGDNLKEMSKYNKKSRTGNYEYYQQKSGCGNPSQFQQWSTTPTPYQLLLHTPSFDKNIKVGHEALSLRGVIQVTELSQIVQSYLRTIQESVLQTKRLLWVLSLWPQFEELPIFQAGVTR